MITTLEDKKFVKKTLLIGQSYEYKKNDESILVNTNSVTISNVVIKDEKDLKAFAEVLTKAWKSHSEIKLNFS